MEAGRIRPNRCVLYFSSPISPSLPSLSLTRETNFFFRVLSGLVVLQVSCGSRHTLAVVEGGTAYSWGWGACGQVRGGRLRVLKS